MPSKFHELDVNAKLKDRRKLSGFLDDLVARYNKKYKQCSLTYIFCTDEYLLGINQQFLNHDTYTDIITFDLSEGDMLIGEIYISTDRVAENAASLDVAYKTELHRVLFHGALHLCGFKDKTAKDKQEMRAKEDECLQRYFK
ncbi:MAG: rRNA maturation RNase YbeY [Chitinophagales bacterium]|nr:rRNA maturation RNase YbeY [Chitinophagaceae bacterium]MCB9063668.1 rRNA maturation RNase YbeY [Chitinophagales bacterium]